MEIEGSAPKSLPRRRLITVELTAAELHRLIRAIEDEARKAIESDGEFMGTFADWLLCRAAELREAAR
jgi:hypothetical protein